MKVRVRYFLTILSAAVLLSSCGRSFSVEVSNPTGNDRLAEMAEIDGELIASKVKLSEGEEYGVFDKSGERLPSQFTSDGKLIFPVQLKASQKQTFKVKAVPAGENPAQPVACGRVYPERMDDLAWENDKAGFRAYGPTLQSKGERGFGYDIFTKRGTSAPVLGQLYADETNPAKWELIRELRKTDPAKADSLHRAASYHIDHGYGMDCYAVGPTLGAGVAALIGDNGEIVYPWCWKEVEILDNGPLRFRAKLTFHPVEVAEGETVVETRIITLDAGSHFNRTQVSYSGLKSERAIVSGIVLHDKVGGIVADNEKGIIAYEDPTTGPGNGKIFLGHIAGEGFTGTSVKWFSQEESATRNNALGHVLAGASVAPESSYTYWWGFGWDRADIASFEQWQKELEAASLTFKTVPEVKISSFDVTKIFSYIIGLGAAVMMPLIFFILGVCIGIKPGKALKSGLLVGVGFVGLSVITGLLTSALGPALSKVVEIYGLQLKVFDMGWPAAASVAYNTTVGALIIPVCLGVNLLMLLTKTTQTVNIDLWNYWHFAFIGAVVYFASDSILWGFFAAIICYILTLILADRTAKKFQGFYDGMEGISIPQPFSQGFVPFAEGINWLLDKIPGFNKLNIDAEGMKKKFGLLGEPLFLGVLIGIAIGCLSCKTWSEMANQIPYILGLGIKIGAVMELIPRITSLFIEGLKPISEATKALIARKFKGAKGMNIGMSPALVIGHPTTLVVSLLLIPVTLILAVFLPGNQFLPLASLAGMFYIFPLILPITKGNVVKTFIIGLAMILIGLYFVTDLAPYFTLAAQDVYAQTGDTAVAIPEGFLGGSLDFASSPLAWVIFHLTHTCKWYGVAVLVIGTLALAVWNRMKIVKAQKADNQNDNNNK